MGLIRREPGVDRASWVGYKQAMMVQQRQEAPAMRMPRFRFSVRRMMVAVAVIALLLPVGYRLVWLYRNPGATFPPSVQVEKGPIHFQVDAATLVAGRPTDLQFTYECRLHPSIPSGLPYRLVVEAELKDPKSGAVEHSTRWTHRLISGAGKWNEVRREAAWRLTLPRDGNHHVGARMTLYDLFGNPCPAGSLGGGFATYEEANLPPAFRTLATPGSPWTLPGPPNSAKDDL
jgi:hypothetical protein